ncbi:MAG: glycosyltransferase family 39 protein, partial [Phycisphaerae bacterium]
MSSDNGASEARGRRTGAGLVLVLLAVLVGGWLRFTGLTRYDLWLDESCSFYATHHLLDWPDDGPDPRRELAHVPYFFLLRLWTDSVGLSPWGLRSFSAVAGTATVVLVGLVAAALGGRRVGIIAALLAAVHPLHVHYSHEARVYALWMMEASVLPLLLVRAVRSAQPRRSWCAYGVLVWILVLTHYYTLFLIPGSVGVLLLAVDRGRVARQWLVTHGLLAVTLAPLVVLVVWPHALGGPGTWLADVWQAFPPILAVPRSLDVMLAAGAYPPYLGLLHAAGAVVETWFGPLGRSMVRWLPALTVAGLLIALAWRMRRPRPCIAPEKSEGGGARHELRTAAFLAAMVLIFLLTAWTFSALGRPVYVVGRYDTIVWPFVVMALALVMESLARRSRPLSQFGLLAVPTAALLVCSLTTTLAARSVVVTENPSRRAERIADRVAPDDLIVSLSLYRWFLCYEWHRLDFHPEVISFPPWHDRQLCWDDPIAELADPEGLSHALARVTARIQQSLGRGRRVWLLAHGAP